jgi:hypothetical protein
MVPITRTAKRNRILLGRDWIEGLRESMVI